LKDWNDYRSWRDFFETYWKLIYVTAIKAGLNDAEAQDVVQDTMLAVSKSMPKFTYDRRKGLFKSWLLRLTTRCITNHLRRRDRLPRMLAPAPPPNDQFQFSDVDPLEQVPDPSCPELESLWDQEYETALLSAATQRVKQSADPRHFQIFDMCVNLRWPVADVQRMASVSRGMVYLAKHRIGRLIKKEIELLRQKPM
jgi:RNA polymerase sigma-70 factor (ECF subfamily)